MEYTPPTNQELDRSLEQTNDVVNQITVRLAELATEFDVHKEKSERKKALKDLHITGMRKVREENAKLKEQLSAADEEIRLLITYMEEHPKMRGHSFFDVLETGDDTPDMSKGSFIDRYFELEKARGAAWPEEFERDIKKSFNSGDGSPN